MHKVCSSEQLRKFGNHADGVVTEFLQSWNNRLDWPPTKIPERYLRNDLTVALKLECNLREVQFGVFALVGLYDRFKTGRNLARTGRAEYDQFSVFIDNVEIVNDGQRGIERPRSFVRLKSFNQINHSRVCDSLYFSFKTGDIVFIDRLIVDRKFDASSVVFPVLRGRKMPRDMIETRTKVMNNFPGQHGKPWWNTTLLMVVDCLKRNLSLVLWNNGVSATLDKPSKLPIKIADVLVGPF